MAIFSANYAENGYHKSFANDESGFKELLKFANEAVTGFNVAETLFWYGSNGLVLQCTTGFF